MRGADTYTSRMAGKDRWARLRTESVNPRSRDIDARPAVEIARIIADEDAAAVALVADAAGPIARAARIFADAILAGGRAVYVGAGTSGRLGVLDAAELPPTYGMPRGGRGSAVGVIAGGYGALRRSVEGAEDDAAAGAGAVKSLRLGKRDLVIGISASSMAPFVRAALSEAKNRGAATVFVTMNRVAKPGFVDVMIPVIVGPEVIAGSTRMKSGLATKAILHNISTTAMILCGKVYGNRMVDLRLWCDKLRARGVRLVSEVGEVPPEKARRILRECHDDVRVAIVTARLGCAPAEARRKLEAAKGRLRAVLSSARVKV